MSAPPRASRPATRGWTASSGPSAEATRACKPGFVRCVHVATTPRAQAAALAARAAVAGLDVTAARYWRPPRVRPLLPAHVPRVAPGFVFCDADGGEATFEAAACAPRRDGAGDLLARCAAREVAAGPLAGQLEVYATQKARAGDSMAYSGVVLRADDAARLLDLAPADQVAWWSYLWRFSRAPDLVLLPFTDTQSLGHLINDWRGPSGSGPSDCPPHGPGPNARFEERQLRRGWTAHVVALRDVDAGETLLVDYGGDQYWSFAPRLAAAAARVETARRALFDSRCRGGGLAGFRGRLERALAARGAKELARAAGTPRFQAALAQLQGEFGEGPVWWRLEPAARPQGTAGAGAFEGGAALVGLDREATLVSAGDDEGRQACARLFAGAARRGCLWTGHPEDVLARVAAAMLDRRGRLLAVRRSGRLEAAVALRLSERYVALVAAAADGEPAPAPAVLGPAVRAVEALCLQTGTLACTLPLVAGPHASYYAATRTRAHLEATNQFVAALKALGFEVVRDARDKADLASNFSGGPTPAAATAYCRYRRETPPAPAAVLEPARARLPPQPGPEAAFAAALFAGEPSQPTWTPATRRAFGPLLSGGCEALPLLGTCFEATDGRGAWRGRVVDCQRARAAPQMGPPPAPRDAVEAYWRGSDQPFAAVVRGVEGDSLRVAFADGVEACVALADLAPPPLMPRRELPAGSVVSIGADAGVIVGRTPRGHYRVRREAGDVVYAPAPQPRYLVRYAGGRDGQEVLTAAQLRDALRRARLRFDVARPPPAAWGPGAVPAAWVSRNDGARRSDLDGHCGSSCGVATRAGTWEPVVGRVAWRAAGDATVLCRVLAVGVRVGLADDAQRHDGTDAAYDTADVTNVTYAANVAAAGPVCAAVPRWRLRAVLARAEGAGRDAALLVVDRIASGEALVRVVAAPHVPAARTPIASLRLLDSDGVERSAPTLTRPALAAATSPPAEDAALPPRERGRQRGGLGRHPPLPAPPRTPVDVATAPTHLLLPTAVPAATPPSTDRAVPPPPIPPGHVFPNPPQPATRADVCAHPLPAPPPAALSAADTQLASTAAGRKACTTATHATAEQATALKAPARAPSQALKAPRKAPKALKAPTVAQAKRPSSAGGHKVLATARAAPGSLLNASTCSHDVDCNNRVAAEWERGSQTFYPATLTKIHLPPACAATVDLFFDDGSFWYNAPPDVIKQRPTELAARLARHAALRPQLSGKRCM